MKRISHWVASVLLLCVWTEASAEAGVSLWTPPSGFAVGFNEPWIGDYRCDYYSAWLSDNPAFGLAQGVPDGTGGTDCLNARKSGLSMLSLSHTQRLDGPPVLPTQLVKPQDILDPPPQDNNYLPNNYLWGMRKANANVVKFLLFSNLQGLVVQRLVDKTSPVPNPDSLTDLFSKNLDELLTQADKMGLKVYLTVLNAGEFKQWANNPDLPQMQKYFKNLISDPATKSNFKRVLDKLLAILKRHPGGIYAMDFINEIEAPLNVGSTYFPSGWVGARAWIAEMVSYIKHNSDYLGSPFPITTAAGYNYAAQEITFGLFSGIGLDFFDLHEYTDTGQYTGQTALCNKVRGDQQQIILGEYGQKSTAVNDGLQNSVTEAFLYGAARSCFSGALAWKFEGTVYSNPQLGYRTSASGPTPPPPPNPASASFYNYRRAYCAIRHCGASPANSHGSNCGFNPADFPPNLCQVSQPWVP
jgi:hypothetical protein